MPLKVVAIIALIAVTTLGLGNDTSIVGTNS